MKYKKLTCWKMKLQGADPGTLPIAYEVVEGAGIQRLRDKGIRLVVHRRGPQTKRQSYWTCSEFATGKRIANGLDAGRATHRYHAVVQAIAQIEKVGMAKFSVLVSRENTINR